MSNKNKTVLRITILLLTTLYLNVAQAQDMVILLQEKHIVYNKTDYKVDSGQYNPFLIVSFVGKTSASYDTPENSAIALLSAMQKKDYDWWLQCWSEKSRIEIGQTNLQRNRTPEYWTDRWSALTNRTVELRYRADYTKNSESYVLLGYAAKGLMVGNKELESVLVFKKEASKWSASQDLSSDPVFNNILKLWHSTESVLQIQ